MSQWRWAAAVWHTENGFSESHHTRNLALGRENYKHYLDVQQYLYSLPKHNLLTLSVSHGLNADMARILIADDHEGTRGILRVLLQDHPGWEICGEASSNSEALQRSMELKPDVLVKDWVMPGVSNLEITREIARLLPATAIILFSFHDLPELETIAKAAGVHGVASKNLSSLIQAIEKALHSSPNRQSTTSDGVTEPARPQPEDVS